MRLHTFSLQPSQSNLHLHTQQLLHCFRPLQSS
jgi:hypothetical protein